jgi:hypothetical protein
MAHIPHIFQVKLFNLIANNAVGRIAGRPPRIVAVMTMPLVLSWWGGCRSFSLRPEPTVPPSANVDVDEAWHDAKMVAAREPGSMPAAGTGSSMQPVYGDNTLLVITPIDYEQLRAGMTVAYVNHNGVRVVHRLVEKAEGGWRVMGLNNERVDADLVTPKNLLGVIYASFNYDSGATPTK